jgi:hypothetical protein
VYIAKFRCWFFASRDLLGRKQEASTARQLAVLLQQLGCAFGPPSPPPAPASPWPKCPFEWKIACDMANSKAGTALTAAAEPGTSLIFGFYFVSQQQGSAQTQPLILPLPKVRRAKKHARRYAGVRAVPHKALASLFTPGLHALCGRADGSTIGIQPIVLYKPPGIPGRH